ncbi:Nuclear localization sequence-binding protein [Leucoagaricus sp. SymC.cos]|nr:Nuclear localization sequence-binding protein [Leucoagaricus sp. SymC.cos]
MFFRPLLKISAIISLDLTSPMVKADKKSEKKASKAALKPVKPVPATSKEILAREKAQTTNGKEKKAVKPSKKPAPNDSSDSSDSDSESETEPKAKNRANGKAKEESSDESSESSSEDEKPKASQVKATPQKATASSDSSSESESDSEDETPAKEPQPPAAKPTFQSAKSKIAPPPQAASSDSDSDSDSDSEPRVTATKPNAITKVKASNPSPSSESEDDSDDSDSHSYSQETKPTTKPANSGIKASKVSSDSSDSSDNSSESNTDSDSDDGKPKAAAIATKKAESFSSEESGSDSDSSDDDDADGDVKMADAPAAIPKAITNGKRKADGDEQPQAKKVKLDPTTQETVSIFVGHLSWSIDNDRLAQEFAHCGEVVSATVQTDRNTGRSRGFGYVHFTSTEAVEKALEMNGKEIDGRAINVDRSTPPDPNQVREKRSRNFNDQISPPSSTLFIANLPFSINEDTLWTYFENHSVKTIRLPTDRDTGAPKGFGYVELESVEDAKKAFEALSGTEIEGRGVVAFKGKKTTF